jgi:hypothetical protein
VSQVGTTAAAYDVEPRHSLLDCPILFAKLDRITVVQHFPLIEFGVAHARGVAADAADAACPCLVAEQVEEWSGWAQFSMK